MWGLVVSIYCERVTNILRKAPHRYAAKSKDRKGPIIIIRLEYLTHLRDSLEVLVILVLRMQRPVPISIGGCVVDGDCEG